jgi:hypothetical protein
MRFMLSAFILLCATSDAFANVVVSYWEVGGVALAQSGVVIDFTQPGGDYHEYVTFFNPQITFQNPDTSSAPIYQTLTNTANPADYSYSGNVIHLGGKTVSNTTYSLDLSNGIRWGGTIDFSEFHDPSTAVADNYYNATASGSVSLYIKFQVFNAVALLNYDEDYFNTTYPSDVYPNQSYFTLTNLTTGEILWDANTDGYALTDFTVHPGEYLISGYVGQGVGTIPNTTIETYSRAVSLSVVPEVGSMVLIGLGMGGASLVWLRQSTRTG